MFIAFCRYSPFHLYWWLLLPRQKVGILNCRFVMGSRVMESKIVHSPHFENLLCPPIASSRQEVKVNLTSNTQTAKNILLLYLTLHCILIFICGLRRTNIIDLDVTTRLIADVHSPIREAIRNVGVLKTALGLGPPKLIFWLSHRVL